jgi:hypothetical protein
MVRNAYYTIPNNKEIIMGINMELMRKKLSALRGNGKNDKSSVWFKPDEGDTDVRIVPTADGDPLKEVHFHYNIEGHKGGVMCPKRNFGEQCPICEFASQLWRDGTDNNDEETKKLAKSLFARNRYFSPVVVRGLESEGVKVYGYGKTAYELLLGYILDPEYGDITDPEDGTDITITYTKPKKPGAYPQTNMKMRRNTSTLLKDEDAIPGLLQNMPDIDALFTRYSPEEVDAILNNMLSGDKSAESRSREIKQYNNNKKSSVDKAFDELMTG